jgi:hypothetical protein
MMVGVLLGMQQRRDALFIISITYNFSLLMIIRYYSAKVVIDESAREGERGFYMPHP